MKISEFAKDKDQLFLALFTITPMMLFSNMGEFLIEPSTTQTVIRIFLGGFGGLIGFVLFYFLKEKSVKTKIISFVISLLVLIGIVQITYSITKPRFPTCAICGYESIDEENQTCHVCGNDTWKNHLLKRTYPNKKAWIREQQLFWFAIDNAKEKPNFYLPNKEEGYDKDPEWKPSISETDLKKALTQE